MPKGITKVSLNYTPQAQDDFGSGDEDLGGYLSTADLLLNDLGGSAKTFYGIDQTDPSVATSTS